MSNEISELCKRTGEPVYLTKNGSGDLVVMDVEAFARRESMLKLKEKLQFYFSVRASTSLMAPYFSLKRGFSILPVGLRGTLSKIILLGRL